MTAFFIIAPIGLIIVTIVIVYINKFSYSKAIEDGKTLLDKNETKEALRVFRNLVNKRPFDPAVHFYLAEAYYQSEDFDWAMTEFKKVESFNRHEYKHFDEKLLHERLADLYLRFGQTTEAQKSLLSILDISPNDYDTHIKIGDIFFKRTLFDNALSYYQKALSIRDYGSEALFKCGEVFYYKKDYNQALGYLKGAVKHQPTLFKANYYIGMIYKSTNNFAKALSEFEKASQNREVRVRALFQKGVCLLKLNEPIQAISTFERGLKAAENDENVSSKSPLMLSLRYHLAETYESEKKILAALDQWEKIAEQNPEYEDVPDKLKMYSDLRVDDRLKDFLTATDKEFERICIKIIGHNNQKIMEILEAPKEESFQALVSESEGEWIKARTTKKLIQFHRHKEPINDKVLRNSQEKMKKLSASGVMVYSSSGFTPKAMEYSQTRPVKLLDRDSLSEVLKEINWNNSQ